MSMDSLIDLTKSRGLHICHINIRSVVKNIDQLKFKVQGTKLHIIGCSESWLHPDIDSAQVSIPGYDLIRCDRTGRRGGGVCVYVKHGVNYRFLTAMSHSSPNLEIVTVQIILPHTRPIYLCNIYRPPTADVSGSLQELGTILNTLYETHNLAEVHVMGDININSLAIRSTDSSKLWCFCFRNGLSSLIREPTHDSGSCIDACMTNRPEMLRAVSVIHIGITDHSLLFITRKKAKENKKRLNIKARSFKRFNEANFIHDLESADWTPVLTEIEPNKAWDKFLIIFNSI